MERRILRRPWPWTSGGVAMKRLVIQGAPRWVAVEGGGAVDETPQGVARTPEKRRIPLRASWA